MQGSSRVQFPLLPKPGSHHEPSSHTGPYDHEKPMSIPAVAIPVPSSPTLASPLMLPVHQPVQPSPPMTPIKVQSSPMTPIAKTSPPSHPSQRAVSPPPTTISSLPSPNAPPESLAAAHPRRQRNAPKRYTPESGKWVTDHR